MYADKVIHLKHVGNGLVKRMFQTTTGLTMTEPHQYKLLLSCMCSAIQRYACFSSTMNCLLLKGAAVACTTRDPFKPLPPV